MLNMLHFIGIMTQDWLGLPKHIFFFIILLLIAGIFFLCKIRMFRNFGKKQPWEFRNAKAMDDHKCTCSIEVEVDNWLMTQRIPHSKPEKAKKGEFFSKSEGVPNFIVYYPDWTLEKVHSIIEIRDIPRPKNMIPIVHTPDIVAQYPYFKLDVGDFSDKSWQKKMNKFYTTLQKDIQEWSKERKMEIQEYKAEQKELQKAQTQNEKKK